MNMNYQVDEKGYYGRFGGAYIPEILHKCVEDLRRNYLRVLESESFREEYRTLLRDYVGRPSPLYFARRLSERYGCRIYLKREDLNHTGAHKINNTIGQILIDKTQLTPARILVGYIVAGVFLSAIGVYAPLAQFAGAGASVPLTGFGHALVTGVKRAVQEIGFLGAFTGGLTSTAAGISAAVFFGVLMALIFQPRAKE